MADRLGNDVRPQEHCAFEQLVWPAGDPGDRPGYLGELCAISGVCGTRSRNWSRGGADAGQRRAAGRLLFLLGRYPHAIQTLTNADGGAVAHFYWAGRGSNSGDYPGSDRPISTAARRGLSGGRLPVWRSPRRIGTWGRPRRRCSILDQMFGPVEQTAEYLYQRGATVAAVGGNPVEVVALYERAVDVDGRHVGALFGLALENDRRGNDDEALRAVPAGGGLLPHAPRGAVEPGRAVRGPAAVRSGSAVLPADPGRAADQSRGPACSPRMPRPPATCSTTRRPRSGTIGWPRS